MHTQSDNDHSERIYEAALRRVLWGDGQEEIMHLLEVNGIAGGEATELYMRAMSERIASIRGVYWKRIPIGLLLVALGVAILFGLWYMTEGFTVFSLLVMVLPAAPIATGAWYLLNGLIGVLTAASRTGPVSDID